MVILGYVLVIIGLVLVILPVLAKLGIIKSKMDLRPGQAGPWNALA
jgi:hypothetical protein